MCFRPKSKTKNNYGGATMAERFSEQSSNRRLIAFLKTILVRIGPHQVVGDEFTQERLAELGVQFSLVDSDWGQLCCLILDSQREVPDRG
jgi:hypothetical protein